MALEVTDGIFEKLNDPDFVDELVRFGSASEIKKFLIDSDKDLDDEDAEKLSFEIFDIVSALKKMDEKQLEKVAGGVLGIPIPTDITGAACFATKGGFSAAEGIKQADAAQKIHHAAEQQLAMRKEINRRRNMGRYAVVGAAKTKYDTINVLAFATMASLGALALLKFLRRGGEKKG